MGLLLHRALLLLIPGKLILRACSERHLPLRLRLGGRVDASVLNDLGVKSNFWLGRSLLQLLQLPLHVFLDFLELY